MRARIKVVRCGDKVEVKLGKRKGNESVMAWDKTRNWGNTR